MKPHEAVRHLGAALASSPSGKLSFSNGKVLVKIKITGHDRPLVFRKHDNVAFRIEDHGLTLEDLKHPECTKHLCWSDIEQVLAGEPEAENESLFQG